MAISRRRRRNPALRLTVMALWVTIVTLVLLWQSANYESVMSVVAEWQFDTIGRYYPTFSYLLIVLVLTLPAVLLFARPRTPANRPVDAVMLRSARSFSTGLFALSGALLIVAVGVLLSILRLPNDSGALQSVTLDEAVVSPPNEGLTRLSGTIAYDRTTAFDEDLIITRRNQRFAPMIAASGDPADLQFFVELPPATAANRAATSTMTGVLQRGGLPGEVIRLYRYAGYRVEEPYYVLFTGTRSIRWARFVIATQLILGSILVALMGLWQHRRSRKLTQTARVTDTPAAAATPG